MAREQNLEKDLPIQPTVKFVSGGLTLGVWGSYDASGYAETDPYLSFSFPFGLSVGLTNYYYPGLKIFNVSDTAGSNALELNAGFTKGGLSLSANYIVNQAGGAGSAGGDKYFQAAYAFTNLNLFVGAGDGVAYIRWKIWSVQYWGWYFQNYKIIRDLQCSGYRSGNP